MELLLYLLKVSACSALFFAFYVLSLKKLTFFKANRFYLLVSVMLSFVIPALQLTVKQEVDQLALADQGFILKDAPDGASGIQAFPFIETQNQLDWKSLVPFLYLTVVIALLCLMLWRMAKLLQHVGKNNERLNGLKLVEKQKGFTNCSFFNYVFIDRNSLTDEELAVLLKHEEVHARQLHSADKLFLMLAKAVLWFNPIIYFYDRELEQLHEYEADEATSRSIGAKHYAQLLLKLAVAKANEPLIHNFVKSPVKARIKMLFHTKSKRLKKLVYLLALPVVLGLVWGFTVDVVKVLPAMKTYTSNVVQAVKPETERARPLANQPIASALIKPEFAAKDTARLKAIGNKLPKLLYSSSARIDTRLNITYIKNGKMEISGHILEAEAITWDRRKGIISAEKASVTSKDGTSLSGQHIVFDLNKGSYWLTNASGFIKPEPADLMKLLEYSAKDSIKNSKVDGVTTLYGDARVDIDGIVIVARKIELDRPKAIVRAYDATMSKPNEGTTKAKEIHFDLKTKAGIVFGLETKKQ